MTIYKLNKTPDHVVVRKITDGWHIYIVDDDNRTLVSIDDNQREDSAPHPSNAGRTAMVAKQLARDLKVPCRLYSVSGDVLTFAVKK